MPANSRKYCCPKWLEVGELVSSCDGAVVRVQMTMHSIVDGRHVNGKPSAGVAANGDIEWVVAEKIECDVGRIGCSTGENKGHPWRP